MFLYIFTNYLINNTCDPCGKTLQNCFVSKRHSSEEHEQNGVQMNIKSQLKIHEKYGNEK